MLLASVKISQTSSVTAAAASQYFDKMFSNEMAESRTGCVSELDGAAVAAVLIDYCYTGELENRR